MSNKYESGYTLRVEEKTEVEKKAKKQAEFYLAKLAEIKNEPENKGQIKLIHFFKDGRIIQDHLLKNQSPLYDCDREWLNKLGLDVEQMDVRLDNNVSYLVAIPAQSLGQWINTKSWLKLSRAGTLDNAVILSVPKTELIFREHDFVEQSFLHGDGTGKLAKEYYESTNKEGGNLKMTEAWLPKEVSFTEEQLLQYQEKH
ncbi:hypothetical protein COV56_03215 [Candidatus Kuenenbacteria bacterium CG11_big_fil_rev_8_21_14_0_20_37_9]|nr:MAG: hypothetical protein COV56_03215 [Candidatus Kuenenbacteria bacterium CG11_big_fil_rev_8_21_14_0_20_37_9]